jgi:type II secretory pathway component PulM
MQAVAPRLRSMPAVNPDEPLPLLVDRTARDAGLSGVVKSTDPSDGGGLRVRLEGAPFDATVIWLARLQQERGMVVEFATFEGTGTEGLVNVLLIFRGA